MTDNRLGIKRRNKMVTMKKNRWKWFIIAAIIVLAVVVGINQTSFKTQAGKDEALHSGSQSSGRTDIAKIEIILDENGPYWNDGKPITITDNKMIDDIMAMIEQSKPLTDESKISQMSGMARKNNRLTLNGTDGSKKELTFAYDTLYEIGYIDEVGKKLEPDYSFFRYIADLKKYTNPDTNIEI